MEGYYLYTYDESGGRGVQPSEKEATGALSDMPEGPLEKGVFRALWLVAAIGGISLVNVMQIYYVV